MTAETTKPERRSETPEQASDLKKVRLWDPALRIFHWLLVICVAAAWGLAEFGPDIMTLHFYFGYAICVLLVFRLIWGFVGPKAARFSHFIYGPQSLFSYLGKIFRREPSYWPGHNPLGALAAFALLGILTAQAATGLMSDPDDFINVGPLASYVGYETATWASDMHHIFATLLQIIVIVHVLAIVFYKVWKHENLVTPMITGWKWVKKTNKG
ncbi:Cytochrome b [Cohaesibacter sp. ES.047]|uniref:cytochrome b/b6 domain-containing protein n=1 Tax=Cohaesibacter sp. ES.047 TaxID=1798205 RepID=UPI000BB91F46|nr:cytochrome b/b6 domain-containing protein [Cohaesibacter sp. ES.047]SNY90547.1 Cytochrome b [Cohaesibacter sp. ES.047]